MHLSAYDVQYTIILEKNFTEYKYFFLHLQYLESIDSKKVDKSSHRLRIFSFESNTTPAHYNLKYIKYTVLSRMDQTELYILVLIEEVKQ